ncbi:MAG: hypothetical protein R3352_01900 [Salinisphaeraceae bacterium]|nr:hypothetical protein [Salinisphaeraceae bacterium]
MSLRWQSMLVCLLAIGVAACAPSRVNPDADKNVRVVTVVPGMVYESNSEVARAETVIALAKDAGAEETQPQALGSAYQNLERSRMTYEFAWDEGENEPEDELQIKALWYGQRALADAELALAAARAERNAAKVAKLQRSIETLKSELQRLANAQAGKLPEEAAE